MSICAIFFGAPSLGCFLFIIGLALVSTVFHLPFFFDITVAEVFCRYYYTLTDCNYRLSITTIAINIYIAHILSKTFGAAYARKLH